MCLERVLQKAEARERKFGLMACEHAFCLGCIRSWRQKTDGPADLDSVSVFLFFLRRPNLLGRPMRVALWMGQGWSKGTKNSLVHFLVGLG